MQLFSRHQLILLLILVAEVISVVQAKRCRASRGKFYSENPLRTGRCNRCEICPPGQEWDINATIRKSKKFGDLECYPCTACKADHYKERDTLKSCSPCLLECGVLHRYLDVPCGGVRRGHCGSCLPGYEDTLGNTEMPCTLRKETGNPLSRAIKVISTTPKPTTTITTTTTTMRPPASRHWSSNAKDIVLFSLGVAVVLVLGVLAVWFIKCRIIPNQNNGNNRPKKRPITAQDVNSSTRLFSSDDSVTGHAVTYRDVDVEFDGPTDDVRAELQSDVKCSLRTVEDAAISPVAQYPTRILTKDDYILSVIAKHVYGDSVVHLFLLLHIPPQTLYSEKELWKLKVNLYKDYMLNVLIDWVKRECENATLDVLCQALYTAGFHKALDEVDKELLVSCVSRI